jgi:hypothetical protein
MNRIIPSTIIVLSGVALTAAGTAHGCESVASMTARIAGSGSAIGGVPCVTPSVPSVPSARLPSGVPSSGALGLFGAALEALKSNASEPAAPRVRTGPVDDEDISAKLVPWEQAMDSNCSPSENTQACHDAQDAYAAEKERVICAIPNNDAQCYFIHKLFETVRQRRAPVASSASAADTATNAMVYKGVQNSTPTNPADVPYYIDTRSQTYYFRDGMTYQALPGDTTSPGAQRLCQAGYTNACAGSAVQFNSRAPAATSTAAPAAPKYDYQAAMRQYEQEQRQYEQAQQLYQSKLKGGPRGNP